VKVVVLAGGLGSRLSEETGTRPKPMVEIGGRPILWHIMKLYGHQGFNDFIICLGYKGYVIKEFFANYFLHTSDVTFHLADNRMEVHRNTTESWRVTLVDTGEGTQTGGRIKRILPYVREDPVFALTYGDGLADIDLRKQLEFHRSHGGKATVTAVRAPARFGAMRMDGNLVTYFGEKRELEHGQEVDGSWINGGFFMFSPSIGELIHGDQTLWEREPMEALVKTRQLRAFYHHGFWQPMDTLHHRQVLEEYWAHGNAPWKIW
jgi:glucose-1-phosphate cytidylyltransferase